MYYSADSLPFVLEFFTDSTQENKSQVREYWGRGGVSPRSPQHLIQVKEGIQIGARLYAKSGEAFDPQAKVLIQTGTYDDDGKQIELIVPITIPSSEEYLFKYENNQTFPWRLGVYFFEVHYADQIYASAIFVTPIHLSTEQVQHMHMLLEREIEGICYELIYTSQSTGSEHNFLESKSYYDYVLRLMNEEERIRAAIARIERNLLNRVRTNYEVQPFEARVDGKSLRWKERRGDSMFLNKKKELYLDIPQNQWMKHVLTSWKQDLMDIEKQIEEDCKELSHAIKRKEEEKKENEDRKRRLWNERDISQESRDSMKSKSMRLEDEIKKAERQLGVLSRWNTMVKNISGRFGYCLSATELSTVTRGFKKPQLKNEDYRILSDLYEEGKKVLVGESKTRHVVQILKPTWKIYEQFVYFQVIDILRRQGFSVTAETDLENVQELQSGTRMELENEQFLIHVWYDKLIYLKEEARAAQDLFFSTRLIQPDIRLDLYQKEPHRFLSTIAMDAKHRKYKSLHNEQFTTSVVTQLSKYNNIYYLGKNTSALNRRRSVVSSVLCLYSRDRDAKVKQEEVPLVFIQLFPELDQDQITGYAELRDEIKNWIEENDTSA